MAILHFCRTLLAVRQRRARWAIQLHNRTFLPGVCLALLLLGALPGTAHAAPTLIFVDKDAAGPTYDGASWATAYKTVQAALDVANANGATDYEIWVAAGTYYPDEGGSHANNSRAESFRLNYDNVQLYGGFAGTETARDQRNWAAQPTVLSGDIDGAAGPDGNAWHVVYLDGVTNEKITTATVVDGFTISGGNTNSSGPDSDGGGLYCSGYGSGHGCSPTLNNLTISGNSAAGNGGGMYHNAYKGVSSPVLTNVTISGNNAAWFGGGMYNNGDAGGVSSPVLVNVTVSGNSAYLGGGMYNYGCAGVSSPVLTNVTVSGNNANVYGGGMFNHGGADGVSSPVLTNVTISGNRAALGSGMYNDAFSNGVSSPVLVNSIVWGNTASTSGAQLYDAAATPSVSYSNIQGGYAGTGNINADPLFAAPVAAGSAPTMTGNYRLAFGSPAIDKGTNSGCPTDDLDGRVRPLDGGGDDAAICDMGAYETPRMPHLRLAKQVTPASVATGALVTYTLVVSNVGTLPDPLVRLTDTLPANVTFGAWVENPGAAEAGGQITWSGSLVQGAAITFTFTAEYGGGGGDTVVNTAQASNAEQALSATAGFSLSNRLLYVDKDAPGPVSDGLSWGTAYRTVQAALDRANANSGTDYEIWVAAGTYYPDEGGSHVANSRAESFRLNYDNVQLYGGFAGTETAQSQRDWAAHPVILSGDIDQDGTLANNAYHVLWLDGVTNEKITTATVVDGFTISGGNANGSNQDLSGGGLYCVGSNSGHGCSPALRNLIMSGNNAGAYGGGMYNVGWPGGESSPTLTNVTLSGNRANYGGGMYNDGYDSGKSSPLLTNVTLSGNRAELGGGMYNNGGKDGESSPVLVNVTVSGNSAGNYGGGMYNDATPNGVSSPVLVNSIVWGNTASTSGAQLYDDAATPSISYSNIQGGYAGTGNINADPLFAAPVAAGSAPTMTGDYRLLSSSPAIDAGTNSGAPTTDRRGLLRPVNALTDMGAYESQGFTLAITGGNVQTATVGAAFSQPLTVQIAGLDNEPLSPGSAITFTPPDSGAGVTVTAPFTVAADASGAATTLVTANGIVGSYAITATLRGAATPVLFRLENTPVYVLAAVTGPGSGSVTSEPAGMDCGVTCTVAFDYSTPVTLTAGADTGSTFGGWSGACSGTGDCTLTITETQAVTAAFTLNQYTVGVSAEPAAGGSVSGGGTVSHGDAVTATATANTGYTFVNWTEGGTEVSTSATYLFTAAASRTLVAHFGLNQYTVGVSAEPAAGGSVSGGGTVSHGDAVTVTATANTGYTFVNWTEGGTEVSTSATYLFTAAASRTLVAHFGLNQYTVTVSAEPAAGGSVSGGGTVSHGDVVTATATANTGYTFVNWTEGGTEVSTSATYLFTAAAGRTLVAHFGLNQYTVTVSAEPAAGGSVSGGGTVSHGDAVTVTATANTGYTFTNWTEGEGVVSTSATYSFTAIGNRTLVAHFARLPQPLAFNDAVGVLEGNAIDVAVLANDEDPASSGLVVVDLAQPVHGASSINVGSAGVHYAATPGFSGEDSFAYTIQDANGLTSTGTIVIVIAPLGQAEEAPQLALINPAVQQTEHFTSSLASVQVEAPAGFFTGTVGATDIFFLAYTAVITPTEHTQTPPGALKFGNIQFYLTAYLDDLPLHGVHFAAPLTLTIVYNPALLLGLNPATLQLNFWDGTAWSTNGIEIISHDVADATLTVAVSHLSEFALFAAPAPSGLEPAPEPNAQLHHLYLPGVSR